MKAVTVKITGMTCGHCVDRVTKALQAQAGLEVVSVTVGQAKVRYDPQRMAPEQIAAAIEAAGYRAQAVETPAEAPEAGGHEDPHAHHGHHAQAGHGHEERPLTSLAVSATAHCLTGCAIGEVLGMAIGTYAGLPNMATVALSVFLAFIFGYALTLRPLLKAGLSFSAAMGLAFASDTLSIATMEVVDNAVMLAVPGAMDAGILTPLFWGSLALSLGLAFVAAVPVNRWLLLHGKGHAVVHQYHHG
jgi:copper chaperone CopZ